MVKLLLSRTRAKLLEIVHVTTHRHFPKVLANSMPKAGSYLLTRLLVLLGFRNQGSLLVIGPNEGLQRITGDHVELIRKKLNYLRPGLFAWTHMYFYPETSQIIDDLQIKTLTIVRDPRDVCVSDSFYMVKQTANRLYPYYIKMNEQERLMASIIGMGSDQLNGAPPSLDIGSHYRSYLGWKTQGVGLVIKFEDLIGTKGGGDDQIQKETVNRIVDYLGLGISRENIESICEDIFSPKARTFRKGQIGNWKEHFTPDHIAAFEGVIGSVMEDFGYKD